MNMSEGFDSAQKVSKRSSMIGGFIQSLPFTEEERQFLMLAAQTDSWAVTASTYFFAKKLEISLWKHSEALVRSSDALLSSAQATERQTSGLKRATWVLAIATVVLAFVTLIPFLLRLLHS